MLSSEKSIMATFHLELQGNQCFGNRSAAAHPHPVISPNLPPHFMTASCRSAVMKWIAKFSAVLAKKRKEIDWRRYTSGSCYFQRPWLHDLFIKGHYLCQRKKTEWVSFLSAYNALYGTEGCQTSFIIVESLHLLFPPIFFLSTPYPYGG